MWYPSWGKRRSVLSCLALSCSNTSTHTLACMSKQGMKSGSCEVTGWSGEASSNELAQSRGDNEVECDFHFLCDKFCFPLFKVQVHMSLNAVCPQCAAVFVAVTLCYLCAVYKDFFHSGMLPQRDFQTHFMRICDCVPKFRSHILKDRDLFSFGPGAR